MTEGHPNEYIAAVADSLIAIITRHANERRDYVRKFASTAVSAGNWQSIERMKANEETINREEAEAIATVCGLFAFGKSPATGLADMPEFLIAAECAPNPDFAGFYRVVEFRSDNGAVTLKAVMIRK